MYMHIKNGTEKKTRIEKQKKQDREKKDHGLSIVGFHPAEYLIKDL